MKFNVVSGKNKGLTFEVVDTEVTIGRKKDNTVVLEDERASGHHAKIYPEGDELIIEDCGSINGTELNGHAEKKAFLHPGDEIMIGSSKIVAVAEDDIIDETADAKPKKGSKDKKAGKGKGILKQIIAALLLLAVLAMLAFLVFPNKFNFKGKRGNINPAVIESIFHVYYEKVDASSKNVFRYEVKIEGNSVSVNIDDLRQKRQIRQSKIIDPKQLIDIRSSIKDQRIFELEPKREGKSTDIMQSYLLKIVMNGEAHEIQVINQIPPDGLKRVCSGIEKFVEAELAIPAVSQSSDELRKLAQDSFLRARKLYDERFVNASNLYDSIKAYKETIWYLESFEPKPSIYADAIHGKQIATEELDQQLKDHEFRSVRAIQLKEWPTARDELRTILKKMPDTTDPRNQDAQQRLMDVDNRLKPK